MNEQSKSTIYLIYRITNLINGKIYIGQHQTTNVEDGYMGSGKLINQAIQKYGIESFRKEILFTFSSKDEMNAKEAELVNEAFISRKDTYNITLGGLGGFSHIDERKRLDGIKKWSQKFIEFRDCKWCKKTFSSRKHDPKKFCSRSCGAKFSNLSRIKEPNAVCAWCLKPITRATYLLELYPRHFCSKSHQVSWYNKDREKE